MGNVENCAEEYKFGISAKKFIYEVVFVPSALYGAVALGMRTTARRKVDVRDMTCLKSLVGVSVMDG